MGLIEFDGIWFNLEYSIKKEPFVVPMLYLNKKPKN